VSKKGALREELPQQEALGKSDRALLLNRGNGFAVS
jgi:hypothetical protein